MVKNLEVIEGGASYDVMGYIFSYFLRIC